MIKKIPGFTAIIRTDYLSLVLLLSPIVAVCIFLYLFTKGEKDSFIYILAGTVIICPPLLFLRVNNIRSLFSCGEETTGRIHKIQFFRDRAWIFYQYEFDGSVYNKKMMIHRNKTTRELRTYKSATILVNADNPRNAILKDIFS
jgi:hypothetical protein